jgi:glucose-6-phosphate dehydrogenase assembly protein OpcA
MTTLEASQIAPTLETSAEVPLSKVEAELTRQLKAARLDLHSPVQLVRMSNLIVYCTCPDQLGRVESAIPAIVVNHPARVILLLADPAQSHPDIKALVLVRKVGERRGLVSEQITLKGSTGSLERLTFAVRKLLVGDIPTNLWWTCSTPPPLAGPILESLAEHAQQFVFDSLGWNDPIQGVASVSKWLDKFDRITNDESWRTASDVNWRRLKVWRRLLSQALDPSICPGLLANLHEVVIEHGPHAVTQAWQIAGWLASRLGWVESSAKLEPNVEIAFQFQAPQGVVTLRIDRLADGPSEIRRIRMAGTVDGKPEALEFVAEDGDRLSVKAEGVDAPARTVAAQPRPITELIARQLSDREPDPVFAETMKVAQQLASRVVG